VSADAPAPQVTELAQMSVRIGEELSQQVRAHAPSFSLFRSSFSLSALSEPVCDDYTHSYRWRDACCGTVGAPYSRIT
jgi:hypothetical protein